jgi:predicted nucleic acid-binding protein
VILYLDTSALVKLYVEEVGSREVGESVEAAASVATARISYAEARAAFARHARDGGLTRPELRRVVRHFDEEWGRYVLVEITDAVVRRAGGLAERHALRGYDAVQLAAALDLHAAGSDVDLRFVAFDGNLVRAARREHLPSPRH